MKTKYALVVSEQHKFRLVQIIFYNQKFVRVFFYDDIEKIYWWFELKDLEVINDSP